MDTTNPRVYLEGKPKTKENIDKEATKKLRERSILSNEEIDAMIQEADNLKFNCMPAMKDNSYLKLTVSKEYFKQYYALRAKALICLVKKFGKRRSEIARLELRDLKGVDNELEITFHLSKKHKRGLHQFLEFCEKDKHGDPSILLKPLPEIKQLLKEWQKTEEGHSVKNSISLQSISLSDKYAKPIIDYVGFLKRCCPIKRGVDPELKFLFPSGKCIFGETYIINREKNLSGSQLLRIIKSLKRDVWLHLFRETKGAEIAKAYGRNLTAISEVKDCLDLENEETAYRYVRRYVAKKQEVEK